MDHDDTNLTEPTWTEAVSLYVTTLQAAHRSPGTIRLHRHYLNRLARLVRAPMRAKPAQIRRALAAPNWAAETRKSARSAYAAFYKWAVADGYLQHNPVDSIPAVTVPPGKPRPIPDHVYHCALARAAERERIMAKLARLAALRCAEIAGVHSDDLVGVTLYVRGKGGKVRTVPILDEELQRAISTAEGWVFPSPRGGHLTPGHVSRLLGDLLPRPWTAHTLRHGWGTAAYSATRDLLAVGAVMGHSRPETTRRYVLLPDDALLDAVRGAVA